MSKFTKFTKDDEALLESYANSTTVKGTTIFYLNAILSTVAPVYLFVGINQIEITEQWIPISLAAGISLYALAFATKNFKHVLKHKIVLKRADAVAREVNKKYGDDKKMSKKEKDERIIFHRNEVAEEESQYLAIFITNVLYTAVLFILAFFFLSNLSPVFTTVISIAGAAGAVAFVSTSKQ